MIKYVVFVFILVCYTSASENVPEIKIQHGALKGKYMQSVKGRTFTAFTGIPFAKPPVGDLRFKAPVAADPWEGTLDASKNHVICPQSQPLTGEFTVHGSEDCLYLNVYTPQIPTANKQLLPVIFYIHGGAFIFGSGDSLWYGPEILLDKDVVLVVPNYRLGALGFLSTEDEVVPGNNGLKDQNLALKWTQANIESFGGDPNRITIVGHSAGGAASQFHVLSPLSKDLIKRAIFQSGNVAAVWALAPQGYALRNARRLAEFLNCPTTSSTKMVNCLKEVSANDIVDQDSKFVEWAFDPSIPFKPVVEPNIEGAFLPEHPIDILKSGKAADIPLMTGITTAEGALKSAGYYNNPDWIEEINKNFSRVVPISLGYSDNPKKAQISKKIRKFYFGDGDVDYSTKSQLTDMYTDIIFLHGADISVRFHAKSNKNPVYYYLFGYRGSESHSRLFGDPEHDYGVCHADELLYLFKLSSMFPNYKPTELDDKMSDILTTLWYNFVTTGNPTPDINNLVSKKWEPVQSDNLEYYFIKSPSDIDMAQGLYPERVKFWTDLFKYGNNKVETKHEL